MKRLPVNKIGIGSVQFGLDYGITNKKGITTTLEVVKILEYARFNGIKYIDTASAYGSSEEVLGSQDLTDFKVISKFMPPDDGNTIFSELARSLKKLNLNKMYAYLAHRPAFLVENQETWKTLLNLKEKDKVQKIGFSLNRAEELSMLLSLNMIPDLIQVPYNFFDTRFEGLMYSLKEKGCEIHTRSTFLQGLFFMNPQELSPFFEPILEPLKEIQMLHGKNLGSTLLKHVVEKEFVDVVIVGVNNQAQLRENVEQITIAKPIGIKPPTIPENIVMPALWPGV